MASPVLFGLDCLQRFLESSIDRAIDICLGNHRIADAHLLCEWRNRDVHSIQLLETVQVVISGGSLTPEQESLISPFGNRTNLQALLDAIAAHNGWRFVLISLHYKAAVLLGFATANLLHRKTAEFIKSSLAVTAEHWPLIRDLIKTAKLAPPDVAASLAAAYADHVANQLSGKPALSLAASDYGEQFLEFTRLCQTPHAVGECLLELAKRARPVGVSVNLLLHAALSAPDIDECAELLDGMLGVLAGESRIDLIVEIVSVFPEPALLPRFFQFLIAQHQLDALPHAQLGARVGRVIMNCARHADGFEPARYFDLTLQYALFRDHAELQMEAGVRMLADEADKMKLQDASRHLLLALAYFLHEKCYSLAMECLKKLSLISLQLEVADARVLHLDKGTVSRLMREKDFPFALTVAVAYDMDTEGNWADAIYAQSVARKGDEFLTAFQYFRPITAELCKAVVQRFQAGPVDDEQRDRMKQFLTSIPNLVERYRIAKALNFADQIENMKEVYPVVCEWCERVLMGKS